MYKPSVCSSAGRQIEEMLTIHSNLSHQHKTYWHKNFKTVRDKSLYLCLVQAYPWVILLYYKSPVMKTFKNLLHPISLNAIEILQKKICWNQVASWISLSFMPPPHKRIVKQLLPKWSTSQSQNSIFTRVSNIYQDKQLCSVKFLMLCRSVGGGYLMVS